MKKNPCRWGHEDGPIIEYGMTDCIKRCPRCGEGYMMLGEGKNLFNGLVLIAIIIGIVLGVLSGIFNWSL